MLSELISILERYSIESLINYFENGSFERFVPGCSKLVGCDQGSQDVHFEGPVHIHTAMVVVASRTIRQEDPVLDYDGTDLLAALLHDIEKPTCRREISPGKVSFPGHEAMGAERTSGIARSLGLDSNMSDKLCFLIANHGKAHELPSQGENEQRVIVGPPFWRNLRVLQRADAESCWTCPDGNSRMPSYWDMFGELNSRLWNRA